MKKLILLALLTVVVVASGIMAQAVDAYEPARSEAWQRWLSEDEWSHITLEEQQCVRNYMNGPVENVRRQIAGMIGLLGDFHKDPTKTSDRLHYEAQWLRIYADCLQEDTSSLPESLVSLSILLHCQDMQRWARHVEELAAALDAEVNSREPRVSEIASYLAAIDGWLDRIEGNLQYTQRDLKTNLADCVQERKPEEEEKEDGDDLIDWWESCFIATAAYGTPAAEEIDILRQFRDDFLLQRPAGKAFVALYYELSPPIAEFISEHEVVRAVVREGVVDPAVAVVESTQGWWAE